MILSPEYAKQMILFRYNMVCEGVIGMNYCATAVCIRMH